MDDAQRDAHAAGGPEIDAVDGDESDPFDPDQPTPVVGSWPSLDPRRLGLPALAWLFVAGAGLVVLRSITMYAGMPLEAGPILNAAIGTTVGALLLLLPAALLRRVPDAPRTLPFLFAGLALEALLWLLAPYGAFWAAEGEPFATILPVVSQALGALSPLLVGLGLLRLRGGRPDRLALLAGIALVYLAGFMGQQVALIGLGAIWPEPASVAVSLVWPLTGAVAVWVPVAAWLDRKAPRRFWALPAAAFPLWVVGFALSVAGGLATREQFGGGAAELGWILYSLVWAMPSVLAFIAYGWLTPVPPRPSDAVGGGAPLPLEPA